MRILPYAARVNTESPIMKLNLSLAFSQSAEQAIGFPEFGRGLKEQGLYCLHCDYIFDARCGFCEDGSVRVPGAGRLK